MNATPKGNVQPTMHTPMPEESTLTVRHGATLRERYPLLMAQPSPIITPIAAQAEARGEPVPVGKTAAEVRAAGYVVAVDVPDDARLVESGDVPDDRICTATTGGAITGLVWTRGSRSVAEWLMAYEGVLVAMPPASLAGCHDDLTHAYPVDWYGSRAPMRQEPCVLRTCRTDP